jgi:hypothetical protein
MTAFKILILICSMAVDHEACQPDTAVDVVQGPKVQNEIMCGLLGQTTLAATALAPRPDLEYMKIVCQRTKDSKSAELLPANPNLPGLD